MYKNDFILTLSHIVKTIIQDALVIVERDSRCWFNRLRAHLLTLFSIWGHRKFVICFRPAGRQLLFTAYSKDRY